MRWADCEDDEGKEEEEQETGRERQQEAKEKKEQEKATRCTSCRTYPPTQLQQQQQFSNSSISSSGSTIIALNTVMKEIIWSTRVTDEIASQPLHPETGGLWHSERASAVLEEPALHLESFQRDVADEIRQHLTEVQPVIRLNFHSSFSEVCEGNVLSGSRVHSSIRSSLRRRL